MKHWYHISLKYFNDNPVLNPKVPESACVENEGNIPRICVSDNILFCLRSIISTNHIRPIDILYEFKKDKYRVRKTIAGAVVYNPCCYNTVSVPYLPPDISDFRQNNEHWFITPTKFHYMGRINILKLILNNAIEFINDIDTDIKINKKLAFKQII